MQRDPVRVVKVQLICFIISITILSPLLTCDKVVRSRLRKTMFKAVATAVFSYNSEAADELSFEKDDCIYIKSTKGGHWWYGMLRGRSGCVPRKYLKLQVLGLCKVIKPYTPDTSDNLRLEDGNIVEILVKESDKWYGKIKDVEGWFPPECVTDINQPASEKSRPASKPSTTSEFDEISAQAVLLDDVRKQRPKKQSTSKPNNTDDEHTVDGKEPMIPPAKPKEEFSSVQPKKLERIEPAWLIELKKTKLGKNKSLDEDSDGAQQSGLNRNKVALFKSTPDLSAAVDIPKTVNTSRMSLLQTPKPYAPQQKSANQEADASKIVLMRKSIEQLAENPKRDLEQRVEFLEKLMMTMAEQLTDMRKELMKLKSMELQKIIPF